MPRPNIAKPKGEIFPQFNAQHKLPPPEEIKIGTPYAFTINPGTQYPNNFLGYIHVDSEVTKLMEHPEIEYIIHREISKKGRIHYHGLITFKTYKSLLEIYQCHLQKWFKKCSFEIDTISDPDIWDKYMKKQNNLWIENGIDPILTNIK